MVDATDLKSVDLKRSWGFEPPHSHLKNNYVLGFYLDFFRLVILAHFLVSIFDRKVGLFALVLRRNQDETQQMRQVALSLNPIYKKWTRYCWVLVNFSDFIDRHYQI
jgi:hypothetical protein